MNRMHMKRNCPKCQNYAFPLWVKVYAMWPFTARCRNCGAKVRLKIPRWQNVLVQILAQFAFWSVFILGIVAGNGDMIVAALAGAFIALLIASIPGLFAALELSR